MQLNESRGPALFPSRKCYINARKIDKKKLIRQKACALVNNCFIRIRLFSPNRMYGVHMGYPIN